MALWIDIKYVNLISSRLDRFKDNGAVKNFRCPYCGDSKTSKFKARGYLYIRDGGYHYKCQNCGQPKPLKWFIKDVAPEWFNEYTFEYFKEDSPEHRRGEDDEKRFEKQASAFKTGRPTFKKREAPVAEAAAQVVSETAEQARERMHDEHPFLSQFPRMDSLRESHAGRQYLVKRKLPAEFIHELRYVKDVNKLFKMLPAYQEREPWSGFFDAAMIPMFDEKGKLGYVQLRFFDKDAPLRYMVLEVEGGQKSWGIDRVDYTKPIYVLEGAFDAIYIPNSTAMCGAEARDLLKYLRARTDQPIYLVWDADYRKNNEVKKRLLDAVRSGFPVVLIGKDFGHKDFNDAVKDAGMTSDDLLAYMKTRVFQGLKAELEIGGLKPKPKRPQIEYKKKKSSFNF